MSSFRGSETVFAQFSSNRTKMQWNLLLLVLMGHCTFTACQRRVYRFVNKPMKWSDAQMYCRQNYADLATIDNMEEMQSLKSTVESVNSDGAWIGLRRQWHWSLPGIKFKDNETNWNENEPGDQTGNENCVQMMPGGKWIDVQCHTTGYFVCYNETNGALELIKQRKTWTEAQRYCRQHHTDLISGLNQTSNQKILDDIDGNVAIGLSTDSWKWSDGSNSSFTSWSHLKSTGDCVTMKMNGKWTRNDCEKNKTFFCHDDNLILIRQNKTWEEALDYCREKHDDLVSIHNKDMQKLVQKRAEEADSPHVWLGLRYTCTLDFWFWVSDEPFCYQNWAPGSETGDCEKSGAMEKGGMHHWFSLPDTGRFNFICSCGDTGGCTDDE